jgi:hypothetical protein
MQAMGMRAARAALGAALLAMALWLFLPGATRAERGPGRSLPSGEVRLPVTIIVDDFRPQPYGCGGIYYYNRLGGDRGALNNSLLALGPGAMTSTVAAGRTWGGLWMCLNHPIREGDSIDFSALLPKAVSPAYQSRATGLEVRLLRGTAGRPFRAEVKARGAVLWSAERALTGGQQALSFELPPLSRATELVFVLDRAAGGDYVVLDEVTLRATSPVTDVATAGFVWSYGMLLNDWSERTGLARDRSNYAAGEFDAIQATGALAAATAVAYQLGVVGRAEALEIVEEISHTLLVDLPRYHGLWPHFAQVLPTGAITIYPGTEWSSIDTVIAAVGLLEAQEALGLDTTGAERLLGEIDWADLLFPGAISHGYAYDGRLLASGWDTFGGESWLVALAYAAARGRIAPLAHPTPPTANGSGFIDEEAWLFAPAPGRDVWGADWVGYRRSAAERQIAYYPTHYPPTLCLNALGLFGLSAAEVPTPWTVPQEEIYQAFGVGGRFSPANDGSALLVAPVVVPHYAALIATLRPAETTRMWSWLINEGPFSPLNNVESLMFPAGSPCTPEGMAWNDLKGSWNLALQTLGWGRYLAERRGEQPILHQGLLRNRFLRRGYQLLAAYRVGLALMLR